MEEVGILLTLRLNINLQEIWKLRKNIWVKFCHQTDGQCIEPTFESVYTTQGQPVVQLAQAQRFDHNAFPQVQVVRVAYVLVNDHDWDLQEKRDGTLEQLVLELFRLADKIFEESK